MLSNEDFKISKNKLDHSGDGGYKSYDMSGFDQFTGDVVDQNDYDLQQEKYLSHDDSVEDAHYN